MSCYAYPCNLGTYTDIDFEEKVCPLFKHILLKVTIHLNSKNLSTCEFVVYLIFSKYII